MLKNKSKEQLLELLYQANNDLFNLQNCNDKQSEILKSIAKLYQRKGFFARLFRFFALPYQILQVLKLQNDYFLNIQNHIEKMELTKEQCVEAQKAIAAFENKKIATADYKKMVTEMLGINENCDTCGDVAGRLHDDFQKRVMAEIQSKFPELLPTPPTLKSGQFMGETYAKWLQTYHFKGLVNLLSQMKTAAIHAKQRGAVDQAKLMLDDCERVKEFIQARKMQFPTDEPTTGTVALDEETPILEDIEVVNIEANALAGIEDLPIVEEVETVATDEPQAAKEKKVYTNEEAATLKASGMTLAELGVYYGVDTSTIKRRLDKYELMSAVDKSDEVL